jgi:hypothetical protein
MTKDRDALLAFFDFPAEHWSTSNPIESVFATVRHRTVRTKGSLSATTAKLMVFKLVTAAAKTWRRLKGENQLPKVVVPWRCRAGAGPDRRPAAAGSRSWSATRAPHRFDHAIRRARARRGDRQREAAGVLERTEIHGQAGSY